MQGELLMIVMIQIEIIKNGKGWKQYIFTFCRYKKT